MKQMAFYLLLLTGSASCNNSGNDAAVPAQATAATEALTTISYTDTVVNFGSINMGEQAQIKFEFTNTGNQPLFLTNVRPGCGCTVAEYTRGAIPPGGKGSVIAAFDSNKAHPGSVSKSISVTSNTSNGSIHTLSFNGEIKEQPAVPVN
ncbi:MAG TPA: DUF1573 domain-containing protein [Sediminibacterium sp.]|nr:DUF1573 domain-containing protein [Sediminibacterium sp.]